MVFMGRSFRNDKEMNHTQSLQQIGTSNGSEKESIYHTDHRDVKKPF